jgi:hypothetical protein
MRESVSGRRRQGRPCCKMATPQQKAFCILQFAKTKFVTIVQRLGVCQEHRLRTTPAKWSSRIETAYHRRCGNHKQWHAAESLDRNVLSQRFLACGPRTLGGPRLFRKLNNFSQQIKKWYFYIHTQKKQNLKLKILKRSVKVKEFEIGGSKLSWLIFPLKLKFRFLYIFSFVNKIKYFVICVFVCCVLFVYCFEVQIVEMAWGSAASSSDSVGVRRSQKVKNRWTIGLTVSCDTRFPHWEFVR